MRPAPKICAYEVIVGVDVELAEKETRRPASVLNVDDA